MARDFTDKVPELLAAAARAADAETALLLLRKAKSLDPRRIETYQRIAAVLGERGDADGALDELRALLDVDPLHWDTRLDLLSLEHPVVGSLERASAIVSDLVWERRYPERWFNAGRGRLRSDAELGHDESLLGHLGRAGREGYGVVELVAMAALADGALAVLNQSEPWLEVFEPDGRLRFGIDLWVDDEDAPVVRPADVAGSTEGVAVLADRQRGRVRRFSTGQGEHLGAFDVRGRRSPVGLDCGPDGAIWVLDDGGAVQGYDGFGRAIGRVKDPAAVAGTIGVPLRDDPASWGVAVDARGEVHVSDGRVLCSLGRRGRRPRAVAVVGGGGRPRRGERHGLSAAPGGDLWLAQPGKSSVVRIDGDGRVLERVRAVTPLGVLARPRDVAPLASGDALAVVDTGHARVLLRPAGEAAWSLGIGGDGWRPA